MNEDGHENDETMNRLSANDYQLTSHMSVRLHLALTTGTGLTSFFLAVNKGIRDAFPITLSVISVGHLVLRLGSDWLVSWRLILSVRLPQIGRDWEGKGVTLARVPSSLRWSRQEISLSISLRRQSKSSMLCLIQSVGTWLGVGRDGDLVSEDLGWWLGDDLFGFIIRTDLGQHASLLWNQPI